MPTEPTAFVTPDFVWAYHQPAPRLVGRPRLGGESTPQQDRRHSPLIAVMSQLEQETTHAQRVKYEKNKKFDARQLPQKNNKDLELDPELYERSMSTDPNASVLKTTIEWGVNNKSFTTSTVTKKGNDSLLTEDEKKQTFKLWKMSITAQPDELEKAFFEECKKSKEEDFKKLGLLKKNGEPDPEKIKEMIREVINKAKEGIVSAKAKAEKVTKAEKVKAEKVIKERRENFLIPVRSVLPTNPYLKLKADLTDEMFEKKVFNVPEQLWVALLLQCYMMGLESHILTFCMTMVESVTHIVIPQKNILDAISNWRDFETVLEIVLKVTSERRNDREQGYTFLLNFILGRLVTIEGFGDLKTFISFFSRDNEILIHKPPQDDLEALTGDLGGKAKRKKKQTKEGTPQDELLALFDDIRKLCKYEW